MRKEVKYIAEDGREFYNEAECRRHEEYVSLVAKQMEAINYIETYCIDDYDASWLGENNEWYSGHIVFTDAEMIKHMKVLLDDWDIPAENELEIIVINGDREAYLVSFYQQRFEHQREAERFNAIAKHYGEEEDDTEYEN